MESPAEIWRRWRTRRDHRIRSLPVVVLFPHSACNAKCIMCDIWKGNKNLKQLSTDQVEDLVEDLRALRTRQVVLSGGEPLLHAGLFEICKILERLPVHITLLSTGILLEKHAEKIIQHTDEVIVSLDGPPEVHDQIRQIPGCFKKLKTGIQALKDLDPGFPISARCVIQASNYRHWIETVHEAQKLPLDRISFLAGDVDTEAFNRPDPWKPEKKHEILVPKHEIGTLRNIVRDLIDDHPDLIGHFVAEDEKGLMRIVEHYAAYHNLGTHQAPGCNAPWTSTVIEADGTVRPCFFHEPIGNINHRPLNRVLGEGREFRRKLKVKTDPTCAKCVCWLTVPTARSFI